jgi:hypothetical protein
LVRINENYQFSIVHKGKLMSSGKDSYETNWTVDCNYTPAHLAMIMTDRHSKNMALKAIFMMLSNDDMVVMESALRRSITRPKTRLNTDLSNKRGTGKAASIRDGIAFRRE